MPTLAWACSFDGRFHPLASCSLNLFSLWREIDLSTMMLDMSNGAAHHTDDSKKAVDTPRPSVVGAALISGFCIYYPVPGLRGAAFCLFPGIAQRSIPMALKAAACGFFADLAVGYLWYLTDIGPGYRTTAPTYPGPMSLIYYLPPLHESYPSAFILAIALISWTSTMYEIWMRFWQPRLSRADKVRIHLLAAAIVSVAAMILMIVSRMDTKWRTIQRPVPYELWPPAPIFCIFILAIPICTLVVAIVTRSSSESCGDEIRETGSPG